MYKFVEKPLGGRHLLISLLMVGILAVTGLYLFGGAEESDGAVVASGTCGTNLNWEYDDETTTLTISGSGTTMNNYKDRGSSNLAPWITYQASITNIVLDTPNLEYIGEYAFGRGYPTDVYMKVTHFTIPDSVKSIGKGAFYSAKNMDFNFAPNIESIGEGAFYYTKISWDTLPSKITVIPKSAFNFCYSLKEFIIPEGVTKIEMMAFENSGLTEITIPESVTRIETRAFSSCHSLIHVIWNAINCTYDDSMTSFTNPPFNNDYNLKTIDIGENVKTLPSILFTSNSSYSTEQTLNWNSINGNNQSIGNTLFYNVSIINFGENVEYIPAYLTDSIKTKLTTVNMSDSVTVIGANAFTGVTDIDNKMVLPESVWGYYDSTFTTKADLYAGQAGYVAKFESATADPNYNPETESVNLGDVSADMVVSGTEVPMTPEYMVYPNEYESGTDGGVVGMIAKLIPLFVVLGVLTSLVGTYLIRSRQNSI